ncbi:hypothetical protein ACI3DN_13230 [Sellimonas catena]
MRNPWYYLKTTGSMDVIPDRCRYPRHCQPEAAQVAIIFL